MLRTRSVFAATVASGCLCIASGCSAPPVIITATLKYTQNCPDGSCLGSSINITDLANSEGNPPMLIDCAVAPKSDGTVLFSFTAISKESGVSTDGFTMCGNYQPGRNTFVKVLAYFSGDRVQDIIAPNCSVELTVPPTANDFAGRFRCMNVRDDTQRLHTVGGINGITQMPDWGEFSMKNCKTFPALTCTPP